MQYRIKQGDTLYSIASQYTIDPSYGAAIANINNIYADVQDDGTLIPYDVTTPLPVDLGTINIPDDWLRPEIKKGNPIIWVALIGALALLH